MQRYKRYLKIISEGLSVIDKLKIAFFLPLIHYVSNLHLNILIRSKKAIYYCPDLKSVWMYSSTREPELKKFFNIKKGEAFIDVGANIGTYAIDVATRSRHSLIFAIEPDKNAVSIMRKNVKRNALENIEIIEKVVADKVGELTFYINRTNPAMNTLNLHEITGQGGYSGTSSPSKNKRSDIKKIKVKVTTLDKVIPKDVKIGLLKVDVQGSEFLVLKGARRIITKDRPRIIFEAYSNSHLKPIKKFLESKNYKIKKVDIYNYVANV